MRRYIERYNELQSILNEDIFGPLENDSVLIVVQVHTRINYLRHLIVSLAQARDISRSLIIFSHDYYDEDINDLIQSIDFCKVMQVSAMFYVEMFIREIPLFWFLCRFFTLIQYKLILMNFLESSQTIVRETLNVISESEFDDYVEKKEKIFNLLLIHYRAIIRKCTNANYPDLYGHYREASFTQTKHHWWWKANRVFDQIAVTQHHTGNISIGLTGFFT